MRSSSYLLILGCAGALAFSACFPTINYNEDDDGGQTTTSSTGGSTGVGNNGGSGGDNAGGAGGAGGCEFGVIGSCGPAQKCALVDENLGPTAGTECITPGSKPSYVPCTDSDECEDGLFCNRRWDICQPLCNVEGDCTSGGLCEPAHGPANQDVSGVKTCGANCAPNSGDPCKQTQGPTGCVPVVNATWECIPSNNMPKGAACNLAEDCAVGLGCIGSVCRTWCSPASSNGVDASCVGSEACYTLGMPVFHDGEEFGGCL